MIKLVYKKRRFIDFYKSELVLLDVKGLAIERLYIRLNNVRLGLYLVEKSVRTLY